MASRKNRPVLYELIARSPRPRVWTSPVQTNPPSAAEAASTTFGAPTSGPLPGPAADAEHEGALPAVAVRLVGGRVHLALGWPHVVIAGAVLLALLIAAFQIGARSARNPAAPAAGSDVKEILGSKPEPAPRLAAPRDAEPPDAQPGKLSLGHRPAGGSAVRTPVTPPPAPAARDEPLSEESAERAPPEPAPAFAFKPGYSYVVVQHLPKRSMSVAEKIRDFLTANGVECALRPTGGDIMVVATQPFLTKQSNAAAAGHEKERARQLMDRIRKLGQEFNVIGGYSFDKCDLKNF